jgi:peptidyl-prolyl cis-trans isomerase B (cyclophilin B)
MAFASLVRLFGALCLALALLAPANVAAQDQPVLVIETSMGDITVELNRAKAPKSVENILSYVNDGFFDNTIFHRVISNFMIQGGGFTADMVRKPTRDPIQNEASNRLKNRRGTLSMARTGEIHSATAQFFINVKDNAFLDYKGTSAADYGYAVFGKVTEGMDVVDKIKDVKTGAQDVPAETVLIKTIRLQTVE